MRLLRVIGFSPEGGRWTLGVPRASCAPWRASMLRTSVCRFRDARRTGRRSRCEATERGRRGGHSLFRCGLLQVQQRAQDFLRVAGDAYAPPRGGDAAVRVDQERAALDADVVAAVELLRPD